AFITGEVVGSKTTNPTVWFDIGSSSGQIQIGDTSAASGEMYFSNFSVVATASTCISIKRLFGTNFVGVRADNFAPTILVDGKSNGDTHSINFLGCHGAIQVKGGAQVNWYGGLLGAANSVPLIDLQVCNGCDIRGVVNNSLGGYGSMTVNLANSANVFNN